MTIALAVTACFFVVVASAIFITPDARSRRKRFRVLERRLKAIQRNLDAIDTYEAPNQQTIDALEAEIFGAGKGISGLPGYTWKIDTSASNHPRHPHQPELIDIILVDPNGRQASSHLVDKTTRGKYQMPGQRRPELPRLRTEEELECAVQNAMRKEVERELEKLKNKQAIESIVSKYNGKAVE